MELYFSITAMVLALAILVIQLFFGPQRLFSGLNDRLDQSDKNNSRIESTVKDEVRTNRQELTATLGSFQTFLIETLNTISKAQLDQLKTITDADREELTRNLKQFQTAFDRNVESFNILQKEKFGALEVKQSELIADTAKKLEQMREIG
jgi:DNA recombination protein RmuC